MTKGRTAKQRAASKRNLVKARAARKKTVKVGDKVALKGKGHSVFNVQSVSGTSMKVFNPSTNRMTTTTTKDITAHRIKRPGNKTFAASISKELDKKGIPYKPTIRTGANRGRYSSGLRPR
jgi:hypothetical protein